MTFDEIAAERTREAAGARIESLATVFRRSGADDTCGVGNAWTRRHYGGDFELVNPRDGRTAAPA